MKRKSLVTLRFVLTFFAAGLLLASCGNGATAENTPKDTTAKDIMAPEHRFTADVVDNKKDPACGMPVTAGITDTAQYKSKVLGFCSKECKTEFEKNPEQYIAAAQIK
ncbi:YHS domain-containing protein [Sediminibacterium ginsengisoli]|uniref:YHS domain-containing protein n=1 Tax=Sediminibacterium ginsengisoli TaxID=413434 RepID=A0A1T4LYS7_9BACT|nr:YHS domain-containing protein [Sediminibacterium ginsengisoli]SJZ59893.1 YHS domain-containing protein [Sediminibacterium ginsengisoli]